MDTWNIFHSTKTETLPVETDRVFSFHGINNKSRKKTIIYIFIWNKHNIHVMSAASRSLNVRGMSLVNSTTTETLPVETEQSLFLSWYKQQKQKEDDNLYFYLEQAQ